MTAKPPDLQKVAERWLGLADEHIRLAEHAFSLETTVPFRLIAFHAQQCAEASLKGFLVARGVDFPYTHNIARLRELCGEHAEWAQDHADLDELSPFAVAARYDLEDEPVSRSEAKRAVSLAARALNEVRADLVARQQHPPVDERPPEE